MRGTACLVFCLLTVALLCKMTACIDVNLTDADVYQTESYGAVLVSRALYNVSEAYSFCAALQAQPISLQTQSKIDFILALAMQTRHIEDEFIIAAYLDERGVYLWPDGSEVELSLWKDGQIETQKAHTKVRWVNSVNGYRICTTSVIGLRYVICEKLPPVDTTSVITTAVEATTSPSVDPLTLTASTTSLTTPAASATLTAGIAATATLTSTTLLSTTSATSLTTLTTSSTTSLTTLSTTPAASTTAARIAAIVLAADAPSPPTTTTTTLTTIAAASASPSPLPTTTNATSLNSTTQRSQTTVDNTQSPDSSTLDTVTTETRTELHPLCRCVRNNISHALSRPRPLNSNTSSYWTSLPSLRSRAG